MRMIMRLHKQYSPEVTKVLNDIDELIQQRKLVIENELSLELSKHHDMFGKYLREDVCNDILIKQLREEKSRILNVAIPISITFN